MNTSTGILPALLLVSCCASAQADTPDWVVFPDANWRVLTPREAGIRDIDAWNQRVEATKQNTRGASFQGEDHRGNKWGVAITRGGYLIQTFGNAKEAKPPYPPSPVIKSIIWHWESHRSAAPGSDLWPVTWGPDGHIYTAWGDGGGFGGTNSEGRVSMGFARIEGPARAYQGININGGKNAKYPATFPKRGKTGGVLFVDGTLYARLNLQDGKWPNVNHALAWSDDLGATWQKTSWVFPKGDGHFKPARFLNFGRDYSGVPEELKGYVYIYGFKQVGLTTGSSTYLSRVPQKKMKNRAAYEFFTGIDGDRPIWSRDISAVQPVFTDPLGVIPTTGAVYHPVLKRFLLCSYHTGPGQLGIFDAPQPWGPWTTVAYYETWGEIGSVGHGLNCDFPQKWMSADGRTVWAVFSVYGAGAKKGINAHDTLNLVKATLRLR